MSLSAASLPPVEPGLFATDPPALVGGRCASCDALRFPYRGVCPQCQRADVAPTALSTSGRVYTFTIVRGSPPGYCGEIPYAFGVIELPEGLRVIATIVARDLASIAIDDAVDFELIAVGTGDDARQSYAFRRREPA